MTLHDLELPLHAICRNLVSFEGRCTALTAARKILLS